MGGTTSHPAAGTQRLCIALTPGQAPPSLAGSSAFSHFIASLPLGSPPEYTELKDLDVDSGARDPGWSLLPPAIYLTWSYLVSSPLNWVNNCTGIGC